MRSTSASEVRGRCRYEPLLEQDGWAGSQLAIPGPIPDTEETRAYRRPICMGLKVERFHL